MKKIERSGYLDLVQRDHVLNFEISIFFHGTYNTMLQLWINLEGI